MHNRLTSSLRTIVAVLFMVLSTNFAATTAAFATQPNEPGNGGDRSVECPEGTGLTQQGNNCKITICHRDAAASKPYVNETVDFDAADGNAGNDHGNGDHYAEHTGPVYNTSMSQGDNWGDIIPPIPGIHTGLNWTSEGQAIWNNDCAVPEPELTSVTPTDVTFQDLCGTNNDTYTIPSKQGVVYSVNGTTKSADTYSGNGMVSVDATAEDGYILAGTTDWSHTFNDEDCTPPPTECATGTGLTQQGNNCKITICHRDAAANKPYTRNTVAIEAADGVLGNDNGQGDHYAEHTGPVYNTSMSQGDNWGDIIPPIPGIHTGLNWTSEGQAIWNNDCAVPEVPCDVCPNIEGNQTQVPSGYVKDDNGNCIVPGHGGGDDQPDTPSTTVIELITVTKPLAPTTNPVNTKELVNTGQNVILNIIVGLTLLGSVASVSFATRRRLYS
jgi:hypothetical protein